MSSTSTATPEGQGVTWVELFFDLIFVFSIAQLVGLLHDGVTWLAVGQAALAFWFVWFAWGQFTWSLNAANTRNNKVQRFTLGAAAVAFVMAVSIPEAFHERAFLFAITYAMVRVMGISVFAVATFGDRGQLKAMMGFASLSLPGFILVILGGALGGDALYWLWGAAIVFDLYAASRGTESDGWNIRREHFSERHGLFVIIALGESLIIAAAGLTGHEWTTELKLFALSALIFTFGLWWSYFVLAKDRLDAAFELLAESKVTNVARDSFTMLHFPMLLGIIGIGVVVEEGIVHPSDPFHIETLFVLAGGILLFVGGMGASIGRAGGGWHLPRIVGAIVTGGVIVATEGVEAYVSVLIGLAGIVVIGIIEQVLERDEPLPAIEVSPEIE